MTVTLAEAMKVLADRKAAATGGRVQGAEDHPKEVFRRLFIGADLDVDELEQWADLVAGHVIEWIVEGANPRETFKALWVDGLMVGAIHAELRAKADAEVGS